MARIALDDRSLKTFFEKTGFHFIGITDSQPHLKKVA